MLPIALALTVLIVALLAFRWFERYRFTDGWRKSEFRGAAFGFLMWFGGLFGHRVPPPPQTKVEFTSRGSSLPKDAADKEE